MYKAELIRVLVVQVRPKKVQSKAWTTEQTTSLWQWKTAWKLGNTTSQKYLIWSCEHTVFDFMHCCIAYHKCFFCLTRTVTKFFKNNYSIIALVHWYCWIVRGYMTGIRHVNIFSTSLCSCHFFTRKTGQLNGH